RTPHAGQPKATADPAAAIDDVHDHQSKRTSPAADHDQAREGRLDAAGDSRAGGGQGERPRARYGQASSGDRARVRHRAKEGGLPREAEAPLPLRKPGQARQAGPRDDHGYVVTQGPEGPEEAFLRAHLQTRERPTEEPQTQVTVNAMYPPCY